MHKYNEFISRIQASDEFKNKLIENMKQEKTKQNNKLSIGVKIRNAIIAIMTLIASVVGGGFAYAGFTNKIPFEGLFSEKYQEYEQKIENEYIETDGTKIELQSLVADEGFITMQFYVTLAENMQNPEEGARDVIKGLDYVAFNDEYNKEINSEDTIGGVSSFKTVIIDEKEFIVRGVTMQEIEEVIPAKEYIVNQTWLLGDNVIGDKQEFTMTLDNIFVKANKKLLAMNGKFDVEISKEKILNNSNVINSSSNIKYKKLTETIEKVVSTPIQNVIKLTSIYEDESIEACNIYNEDFIGIIEYEAFDQNGKKLDIWYGETNNARRYSDGFYEEGIPGDFVPSRDNIENSTLYITEYITFANSENLENVTIKVYEKSEIEEDTSILIGEFTIDFANSKVVSENKNEKFYKYTYYENDEEIIEYISADANPEISEDHIYDYDIIDVSSIEEFSIELSDEYEYEIYKYPIDVGVDYSMLFYLKNDAESLEYNMVLHYIDLKNYEGFYAEKLNVNKIIQGYKDNIYYENFENKSQEVANVKVVYQDEKSLIISEYIEDKMPQEIKEHNENLIKSVKIK